MDLKYDSEEVKHDHCIRREMVIKGFADVNGIQSTSILQQLCMKIKSNPYKA